MCKLAWPAPSPVAAGSQGTSCAGAGKDLTKVARASDVTVLPEEIEAQTITVTPGQAHLGDLRSTSGLGLGDGLLSHTSKWLQVRDTRAAGARAPCSACHCDAGQLTAWVLARADGRLRVGQHEKPHAVCPRGAAHQSARRGRRVLWLCAPTSACCLCSAWVACVLANSFVESPAVQRMTQAWDARSNISTCAARLWTAQLSASTQASPLSASMRWWLHTASLCCTCLRGGRLQAAPCPSAVPAVPEVMLHGLTSGGAGNKYYSDDWQHGAH